MPIGRLANTANSLFALGDLKAKLWDISWMARNRFWFAVAPIMYAVRKKVHDRIGVFRRRYAHKTCRETTPRTKYLVNGSGPHNLVTCTLVNGKAQWQDGDSDLWVSLYDGLSPCPMWFFGICPEEILFVRLDGLRPRRVRHFGIIHRQA